MSVETPPTAATATAASESGRAPLRRVLARSLAVGRYVVEERLRGPVARTASDVPVRHSELTREWLTTVLCSHVPGAEVDAFDAADVSSGTSTRWSVTVHYNRAGADAGLPTELFAKTTLAYRQRLILGLAGAISTEPTFFREYRPQVEIEAPKGYHAACDERSWRSISLIENIAATKSATFSTPRTAIDRPQMEDLLTTMATWHGHFWNRPDMRAHGLKTPAAFLRTVDQFIGYGKRSKIGADRARDVMPTELRGRHDELFAALHRSLQIASRGDLTLLHGDPHVGNTYRADSGRMGFTDWQLIQTGCWAFDVAYIMNSGLTIEDRRAWDRDLITHYLAELAATGVDAPDVDTGWTLYRQHSLWPYFAWTFTIGRSRLQPKMQPDHISREIIARTARAIVDLGAIDALGT